ncbi:MAG: hypothetical protein J0M10_00575 [Chitinophagales bacterium]|nr:hypothetical protein [Chitinophagales bacterium]
MKQIVNILPLLLIIVLATGCKKNYEQPVDANYSYADKSIVQLYNATLSTTRNNLYINSTQINGTPLSYGSLFPSNAYGFSSPIGLASFLIRDTLSTSTQPQLSFAQNLQGGKNYTIFMYDTMSAVKQKTIETPVVIPADTTARIRFANFIFSKTIIPAVDIFSKKRNQNIFTNISTTEVTNYIPFASKITDTLYVRATGTTTDLAALNGITPTSKRGYTIIFRGSYSITTGTLARTLSSFVNY